MLDWVLNLFRETKVPRKSGRQVLILKRKMWRSVLGWPGWQEIPMGGLDPAVRGKRLETQDLGSSQNLEFSFDKNCQRSCMGFGRWLKCNTE